jgi:hypothetical protein
VERIRVLREELRKFDELDLRRLEARSLEDPELSRLNMKYGFFPGGNGLFRGVDAAKFPALGALFLGSNYGCVSGFIDERCELWTTDERNGRTWLGLRHLLCQTGINRDECFFTNAWPFLHFLSEDRKQKKGGPRIDPCRPGGRESNDNPPINRWRRDDEFMTRCIDYFKFTVRTVKPKLIVALGKGPALFLGDVWPGELKEWHFTRRTSLSNVKFEQFAVLENRKIHSEEGHPTCCVISHPSRPHNANKREGPYRGIDGEVRLLKQVAKNAGIMTN